VARDLLGCVLVSRLGGVLTAGRIVETEAYLGPEDAASHAAIRPIAARELFYGDGGHAYVFRSYGLHHCLNAITGRAGQPGCVLIRALEPLVGLGTMARRRRLATGSPALTNGPGKLARALGITLRQNAADLRRGSLVIVPPDRSRDIRIAGGPRVGITRATSLQLRFWVLGNLWVSRSPSTSARSRREPDAVERRGRAAAASALRRARR
jgi:DNA-3-methyladenine glycosylase